MFGGAITLPPYILGMMIHRFGNDSVKHSVIVQWLLSWNWGWIVNTGHKFINLTLKPHPNTQPLIERGYVLANHRSFTDFCIDAYISKSSVISRLMVVGVTLFTGSQMWLEERITFIHRGKSSAASVAARMIRVMERKKNPIARYIFYPEGTRRLYKTLSGPDELLGYFRKGLLLTLYQHEHAKPRPEQLPFQIQVAMNKESVINEKRQECGYKVTIPYTRGSPIYAADYSTDDLFLSAIAKEWFRQYVEVGGVVG